MIPELSAPFGGLRTTNLAKDTCPVQRGYVRKMQYAPDSN